MQNPPSIVLGFDFGTKRIGTAVGQSLTKTATALSILPYCAGAPDWEAIGVLIRQWQPTALIVGIPLNMDGSEGEMSHRARAFAETLHQRFTLPVHTMDERLSTFEARERMKLLQKSSKTTKNVDNMAAQIIVEDWLKTSQE